MNRVWLLMASTGMIAAQLTSRVVAARASEDPQGAEATIAAPTADSSAAPPANAGSAEPAPPLISTYVFTRFGLRLQDPTDPRRLDHLTVDELNISPAAYGSVTRTIGWGFSLYAVGQTQSGAVLPSGGNVTVLDLVAKVDLDDAFHLWAGRMVIPSDRSNFSGPFFMSAWDYPGLYVAGGVPVFAGPKGDYLGRGVGATAWGQLGGGFLKYYLGAYELDRRTGYPLYSARVNLALINPEPGYFSGSTYYGAQDILAFGVGGQFQKDGSSQIVIEPGTGALVPGATRDFRELNADLLAEVNLGGGTLSGELAVYQLDGYVSAAPVDLSYFALVKYLVPGDIGGGRFEPLFRYQATRGPNMHMIDAALGYILRGPAVRFHAGFQRTDMGRNAAGDRVIGDAVQVGVQVLYL